MTISGISENIHTILTDSDLYVSVLAAPPTEDDNFSGYPSASHFFVGAESEYATVSQNRRRYEYVIETYLVTNSDTPTATELAEIYDLTDSLVQLLEESQDLSSASLGLIRACDMMRVSPSVLERVQTPEGTGLRLAVRLFCESDISFR